jgi:hypothetical protein
MSGRYPHCLQEESASFGQKRVGLDLDLPGWIEQPGDDEHRGRRTVFAEQLPVRPADGLPVAPLDDVDARADDVLGPRAELGQRVRD